MECGGTQCFSFTPHPGRWGQLVPSPMDYTELFLETTKDRWDYWEGGSGCFGNKWAWLLVRHAGSSFRPLGLFSSAVQYRWCSILAQLVYFLWCLSFSQHGIASVVLSPAPSSWIEVINFCCVCRCCHETLCRLHLWLLGKKQPHQWSAGGDFGGLQCSSSFSSSSSQHQHHTPFLLKVGWLLCTCCLFHI